MRDHASVTQNLVLSNLENLNAVMLRDGMDRRERTLRLNEIARQQMEAFSDNPTIKRLESGNGKRHINPSHSTPKE